MIENLTPQKIKKRSAWGRGTITSTIYIFLLNDDFEIDAITNADDRCEKLKIDNR